MRPKAFALLAALAALLLAAAPALAIRYGDPDNGEHPYVGLVVFYDAAGTPLHRCSGTLLAPTVLLTAGHCTDPGAGVARAQVWFAEQVFVEEGGYPFAGGITGTPYAHPDFVFALPNTSDVGVVVLDEPVASGTYGALPELGVLDALATRRGRQDVTFTVVGYGLQNVKPDLLEDRFRFRATVRLVDLRSAITDGFNIHHTNAPGTGGGTCFGDSGGPVFLGDTNVVGGITSFVFNRNCVGGGGAYRTDIANAQDFILSFL